MKNLLKVIIPQSVVIKIRALLMTFDEMLLPLFAWNRFLSTIYYVMFSRQFDREHQAVLQGRISYRKSLHLINESSVLLRRNTHRIEKGLIMRPRREVFALAYIAETVECYIKCITANSLCREELSWATNVLKEYFSIVQGTQLIDKLKNSFEQHVETDIESIDVNYIPYPESTRPKLSISAEQLEQLFVRRRSVRWFLDKEVTQDDLYNAVKMASFAPSACNRQPFEFINLKGTSAIRVAKLAMGTAGFAENIHSLIVVVGDLSAYPAERDKHVIYIDGSLAAMQLMLAFETMNISSCPINWPDIEFREKKMCQYLTLPTYKRPIMLIAYGYADSNGKIPFSQKKLSKQLLKEITL